MSDSHNPYTPPSATVQDAPLVEWQDRARPAAVVIAAGLLALGPAGLNLPFSAVRVGTMLVAPLMYFAAVILVFLAGREWFARRS